VSYRLETCCVDAAEIDYPAVIGAGVSGRQLRILDPSFPVDANGRIQDRNINPLAIHHLQALHGIIRSRSPSIPVCTCAWSNERQALLGILSLHAAHGAQSAPMDFDDLIVEEQYLQSIRVTIEADRPVNEGLLQVLLPQVGRFQNVPVGIDNG